MASTSARHLLLLLPPRIANPLATDSLLATNFARLSHRRRPHRLLRHFSASSTSSSRDSHSPPPPRPPSPTPPPSPPPSTVAEARAAIIGAYADKDGNFQGLTSSGAVIDADDTIRSAMVASGVAVKEGASTTLTGLSGCAFRVVSVVGLGPADDIKADADVDENEEIELVAEKVRKAVAAGIKDINAKSFPSSSPLTTIEVDPLSASTKQLAIGEAVELALYNFDAFKTKKKAEKPSKPEVKLLLDRTWTGQSQETDDFRKGRILGSAQNLARELMDTPANHMTPVIFAEKVESLFAGNEAVEVVVRDQAWADEMKMGSFTSVSRGSAEPLRFVEIHYRGGEAGQETGIPVAFVGKGVTFDTGGISLKPSAGMPDMKADMGGAACVVGALKGIADLQLPLNVKAFIPLCENMPGGRATKPGDVVTAMNGKTIQVDNTDAEGRLILADALHYATSTFKPRCVVDLATLTGAMAIALGGAAAGVFTNSNHHWDKLREAGVRSGDRVWRMPLWKLFTEHMKKSGVADLNNISSGAHARAAGSCTAAGFLREFVDLDSSPHWMHIDIAGVMSAAGAEVPYLPTKGMAGRPVRTLIGFVEALAEEDAGK